MIEIPLTKGYVTLIDDIDADLVKIKWYASGLKTLHRYAVRGIWSNKTTKLILMHRVILERVIGRPLNQEEVVDHINGNTLDNRRLNLRLANRKQNSRNRKRQKGSTEYKGVHLKKNGMYSAQIQVDKKIKHLGTFATPEEAHKAYCEAAVKYFGEFARFE